MTNEQINTRLDVLEGMMARADAKDLPALNATYQRLIDEQVRRDLHCPSRSIVVGKTPVPETAG